MFLPQLRVTQDVSQLSIAWDGLNICTPQRKFLAVNTTTLTMKFVHFFIIAEFLSLEHSVEQCTVHNFTGATGMRQE
jgi:hypothetical protein